MIIILEGIDGSGKSTVAKNIFRKYPFFKIIHFPVRDTKKEIKNINNIIDNYNSSADLKLVLYKTIKEFALKNFEEFTSYLYSDKDYIFDRSWVSTIVYQSYMIAEHCPEYLTNFHHFTDNYILSFMLKYIDHKKIKVFSFLLDIPVQVSLNRLSKNKNEIANFFEKKEVLEFLRNYYLKEYNSYLSFRNKYGITYKVLNNPEIGDILSF